MLELSSQAWVIAIVYAICIVVGVITSMATQGFNGGTVIAVLFGAIYLAISVYDTHCLTAGGCAVWSWIRTVMYIIFPTIIIIGLMHWMIKYRKDDDGSDDEGSDDEGSDDDDDDKKDKKKHKNDDDEDD
jgi:hypothetical protein